MAAHFNPLFPYGKRPTADFAITADGHFNPLFPSGKRLSVSAHSQYSHSNFNPLFPYGKRPTQTSLMLSLKRFQSTLPIREETRPMHRPLSTSAISIHSSHTGRDLRRSPGWISWSDFNPLFPYGKRQYWYHQISIHSSHTGRDLQLTLRLVAKNISIHSSHTGRDGTFKYEHFNNPISIHSSHTGRDGRKK